MVLKLKTILNSKKVFRGNNLKKDPLYNFLTEYIKSNKYVLVVFYVCLNLFSISFSSKI